MSKFISGLVFALVFLPFNVWAAASVNNLTLNGGSSNVSLNSNDDNAEVTIGLSASEPVKWNTIAICLVSDSVCSRTTAVKYFTQTSSFSGTVSKVWDGQISSGDKAPTGEYKIKATVKNEADEETVQTLTSPVLTLVAGEVVAGNNEEDDTDDENGNDTNKDSEGGSSSHSSTARVTTSKGKAGWQIGAGRERLALVDSLVQFEVDQTVVPSGRYHWSFGDGTKASGASAIHRYLNPGVYEVVVTGKDGSFEAVARTKVTVLESKLALSWGKQTGDLVVTNNQTLEINLGDFKLMTPGRNRAFIFPADTIIAAGRSITLDSSLTGLNGGEIVELYSPMDTLLASVDSLAKQQELLTKLQAELRVAQAKLQTQLALENTTYESAAVGALGSVAEAASSEGNEVNTITLDAHNRASAWERLFNFLRMR